MLLFANALQNVISLFLLSEPFKGKKKESKASSSSVQKPIKTLPIIDTASVNKDDNDSKNNADNQSIIGRKITTRDNLFSEFQRLCNELSSCSSYLEKTAIVKKFFDKGSERGK